MASATVDHRHLRLESLPLVDLRVLSQSDLYSLSLSSSTSSHRCGDDDVLIPKIDRSVFNESAGSRKQTYSRLRLASRNSQLPSSSSSASAVARYHHYHQTPEPLDQESFQIIDLLKQFFSSSSENRGELVPVPVDYNDSVPESSCKVVQNVPIDVVVDSGFKKRKRGRPRKNAVPEFANEVKIGAFQWRDSLLPVVPVSDNASGGGSQGKRKRGRPRKNENGSAEKAKSEEKAVVVWDGRGSVRREEEEVVVNVNGNGVDLVALGNLEDPFGEELRRRTQGLETEGELLGFLGGLEGEWGSWRRKKKIVLASEFGDVLPNGWKVMISLKRKEGRVSLFCRRYVRFLLDPTTFFLSVVCYVCVLLA